MAERIIHCAEGLGWRVLAPARSSPYRLQLVFQSMTAPSRMFRAEAEAENLDALTDEELCFLLKQVEQAEA